MKIVPTICFVLISFYLFPQNYVDIIKINSGTTSLNKFDSSASKTRINETTADLTLPIKVAGWYTLVTGAIFENYQTKLFANENPRSFGALTLKAGFNIQWNERWSGTYIFLPKAASDRMPVNGKDYQVGGIALMKFKKHDQLNYKFGLYYNSELFGPFFVPMFGMYYLSPSKKLEANIMLPLQADVNYQLHKLFNIGCNFNGQIRSYYLSNVSPDINGAYVSRSTNELFAYLKFNITKGLSFQARVGQSVARKYRVYADGDKVSFGLPLLFFGGNRQQLNPNFSDGLIFQGTLLFRIYPDKK
jgi:hypothetical protein